MIQLNKPNISIYSLLCEWFYSFRKRWQCEIKVMEIYKLENLRSISCTQLVVDRWFGHLREVLSELNLFNRSEAIYNVDESAFGDDPGRKQVIMKRNSKFATCIQGGSGKSYTTLLICISASGKFLPPYIIYRAQRLYDLWIPRNGFPGARYNTTSSGWSEEPIFFDWLCNQFVPAVKMVKRPVLLLMDGHHSHLSTRIIKYSMDHGIHLECLPPHTTNILQPLDVLTLSKIKRSWRELLSNHYNQTNAASLTKQKFALLNYLLPAHCSGGFAKAGVYPFDKRAISKEKLLQPATTSESHTSLFESNTADNIGDKASSNTNVVNLRRSSSCPNLSSEDLSLLLNTNSLSTNNNIVTNSWISINKAPAEMDTSINPAMVHTSTTNVSTENFIPDCDNLTSTTNSTSTSKTNTSTFSILTDAMKVLHSPFDEPAFSESIYMRTSSPPDVIQFDMNSSADQNNNNNDLSNREKGKKNFGTNAQSSLRTITNSTTSDRSVLDAITTAINNHMKPTLIAANKRKKQIDRPFGESLTSVDAYIKINNKENARKKKSTKENNLKNKKEKADQTKSNHNKKIKYFMNDNKELLDNNKIIPNDDQQMLNNVSLDPYRQQNGLYSSTTITPSYGTM
ncbi:unnamed protein product, partial [Rotaria sp. Silwood2]